jgi:hypothetical protein
MVVIKKKIYVPVFLVLVSPIVPYVAHHLIAPQACNLFFYGIQAASPVTVTLLWTCPSMADMFT